MITLEHTKLAQAKRYLTLLKEAEFERQKGYISSAERCEDMAARVEDRFKSSLLYDEDWDFYVAAAKEN